MQVIIRTVQLNDLPHIVEIEKICFGNFSYPQFVFRQYFDLFQALFFVAEINAKIAAYSVAGQITNSQEAWFLSMAVLPEFSGLGIASKLKKETIANLSRLGITTVYTTVHPENEKMIAVNLKFGMKIIEKHDNYYGDQSPRLLMKLKI